MYFREARQEYCIKLVLFFHSNRTNQQGKSHFGSSTDTKFVQQLFRNGTGSAIGFEHFYHCLTLPTRFRQYLKPPFLRSYPNKPTFQSQARQ